MSTQSEPGGGRADPGLDAIMSERRQLINLAYRLLGSLADAEDAVQETYARWYAMPGQQREAIESPSAWLTTVASRICLDLLGSARARRERYVGEWLPEPLPDPAEWIGGQPGGATADPADRVTLDESVSMAFLVVLESMTPAERVAFILHDVFGYSFAEVAGITGRSPAACRQLASSARRRIRASQPPPTPGSRAGGHCQGLQEGVGSRGHRRPHRPARPRRHGDRRRRRPRHSRPEPDRGRRADRALLCRPGQCGIQRDDPGAHGQRPARPGRSAGRRHRGGAGIRRRRRPDPPHLGHTQPRQAPALGDGLTHPWPRRVRRGVP
jgi:RNA polymerase sigma factor (sigma-70 family)